jgi:hypothetical protein
VRYPNGDEARLGDVVQLGETNVHKGVVVCSLDTNEYSAEFSEREWSYLRCGILVNFERLGLIHYDKPEPALTLLRRAASVE